MQKMLDYMESLIENQLQRLYLHCWPALFSRIRNKQTHKSSRFLTSHRVAGSDIAWHILSVYVSVRLHTITEVEPA